MFLLNLFFLAGGDLSARVRGLKESMWSYLVLVTNEGGPTSGKMPLFTTLGGMSENDHQGFTSVGCRGDLMVFTPLFSFKRIIHRGKRGVPELSGMESQTEFLLESEG